ncbi:LamG-like jellyroll fold domain-containing protein [Gelidibacter gilvus]|nr:LamG-like jellyroll fold domain-containing protein [Gelidibacter gilvus]
MKSIYLITTSLLLFLALAEDGFSKSKSDSAFTPSMFAQGNSLNSSDFKPLKTTFKALDVSGLTGPADWFVSTPNLQKVKFYKNEVLIGVGKKDIHFGFFKNTIIAAAPIAICQTFIIQLDIDGRASLTPDQVNNSSTVDPGLTMTLSLDKTEFNCDDIGVVQTVKLTVTDSNGESETCDAIINVEDNMAPTASCVANFIIQLDDTGNAAISASDINNGSTDACGIASTSIDVTNFDCSNIGPNPVTLTITDNSGNVSTCTTIVTVEDTIAPNVVTKDITIQLDATGTITIADDAVNNNSTDSCGGLTFETNKTNFNCSDVGENIVELTVTDANGQIGKENATVTVQPYTSPLTVSYTITENKTTICDFETLNFTAKPSGEGADAVTYEWFVNNEREGTGLNFSYNRWTAPSAVVKVIMTIGTGDCAPTKEYASTISVNPVKTVNFDIITPSNICEGDNATFTIGNPQNFGGATYEWTLNGAVISTTATLTTNALTVAGPNTIELTVTSTASCVNPSSVTKSINVTTVNPKPILTIQDGEICASNQTNIDLNSLVTVTSPNAIVTFHNTAANAASGNSPISNVVSPSATRDYFVRSRFNTGCFVTSQLTITVNPLPIITTGANPTICIGASVDLSTLFTGANLTYHSSLANAKSNTGGIDKDVSPTVTTTYYARSEDSVTGCYNTSSVIISVNPLPTLTIDDGAVCSSGSTSVDLNNLVTTNGTKTFYASEANATNATSAIPSSVSPTTQTSYWARTQLSTGCFQVGEIIISITDIPSLTVANGSVCASSQTSINLNTLVTNTNGNTVTFHANQSDAENGTSAITATVNPISDTTYYVRSKFTNGCYSTASILITINPLPTFDVTPAEICNGASIDLSTTVSNHAGTSLTFHNSAADANSGANAINANVSPTANRTYHIRSVNTAGCYTVKPVVISVANNVSLALTSGNLNPNICAGSAIPAMNFKITNGGSGAGATVTASPGAGITLSGSYNTTTQIYTVTGTTSNAAMVGIYDFTVTPIGCGAESAASQSGTLRIFNGTPTIPLNLDTLSTSFVICPVSNETYEVTPDPNVQTYNWQFPAGFTITSGFGTNKVTVNIASGAQAGNVAVSATNICGGTSPIATRQVNIGSVSANAGPDQYICVADGLNYIVLNGNVTGVSSKNYGQGGKGEWWWSDGDAGGTFEKIGPGNSGDYLDARYRFRQPIVPGQVITITIQTKKPTGANNCGQGAKDDMKIFLRGTPTANVISDGAICTGSSGSVTFSGTPNTTVTFKVGPGNNQTISLGAGNGTIATATFTIPALATTTDVIIQSVEYTNQESCTYTYPNPKPTAQIVVNPLNTVTPGPTITVCQAVNPSSILLSGASVGSGAQGQWTIISGGGSLSTTAMTSTPADVTYTPAANFHGDVVLRLTTDTPGTCPSVNANRTITINEAPIVEAGTQGDICESANPTAITLTGASVGGGNGNTMAAWSITYGGGTLSNIAQTNNPASVTYTPVPNYFGPVTLTLTTNAPGGCTPIQDTRTFNIHQLPTIITGTYGPVCESSTPSLIPLSGASVSGPAGATAEWSIVSGGGTLSPPSGFSTTPQNVTFTPAVNYNGLVVLKLKSSTNASCVPVEKTVNIVVNEAAIIDAGPATAIICEGGIVTLNGSLGGSATSGTWTSSSNHNSGFGNSSATSTSYTPSTTDVANGTVTLTFTSNDPDGPCSAVSDSTVVTINKAVSVVLSGDTDICSDESSSIVADLNNGSATSGTWTSSSNNNGGFANTTATSTIYTPSTADINNGTVTLTYTTNDPDATGPCSAVIENLIINIYKKPFINENTENIGVCASQPAAISIVASGDNLNYQWYKGTPGTGTLVTNSPPQITGATTNTLNFANTTSSDAGTYYVIVRGNATCESVTSAVAELTVNKDINITSQPQAVTECVGNAVTFTAQSTGNIGSFQWKKDGVDVSGGTVTRVTSGATTTFSLQLQDIEVADAGAYTLHLISDGGACSEANTNLASLTVTQVPTANISYVTPFCTDNNIPEAVTLTGTNAYTGGTYSYTVDSGGPTLSLNATTGAITPSTSTAGTYTVTYTIPAAGGCDEVKTTTSVTINALPEITAFSYAKSIYCESDVLTYTPNEITVTNSLGGSYSASAGLSINSSTGEFSSNGVSPGTYIITYTANNPNGCTTPVEKTFQITIQAKPDASFSYGATNYCSNGSNPVPTPGFQPGGEFTGSSGLVINPSTGEIDLSTSTLGSHTIYYTFAEVSGGCAEVQEKQNIIITPLPIASITYSAAAYCKSDSNTYPVTLNGSNNSEGTYSASAGLTINSSGTITPSTSTVGNHIITFTIPTSGGCAEVVATANVTIDPLPVADFIYDATQYCKTKPNPVLSYAAGGSAGIFSYTSSPSGLSLGLNSITGAIDLSTSAAGTYTITNTIAASAGCIKVESTPQTITIFSDTTGGSITGYANDNPTVISNNIIACHEGNGTLNLSGHSGAILRWESSTNGGQTWAPISNTTDTYNFTGITATTLFRAVLASGPCGIKNSAIAFVNVIPSNIKPTVSPDKLQTICFGQSVNYSYTSGYGTGQLLEDEGDFNSANAEGWLVDGKDKKLNASGSSTSAGPWVGANSGTIQDYNYNSNDGKFVVVNGAYNSILESPTFNTFGLTTGTLEFWQAYDLKVGAQAIIELSLDGGATYNIDLSTISGPANSGNHNTGFNRTIIDLQNYIGQANLKIRFRYVATTSSAWAIDKFQVPRNPLDEDIIVIEGNNITSVTNGTFVYQPVTPGLNTIGITSKINGCLGTEAGTTHVSVAATFAYAGKAITPVSGECGVATVKLNAYDNTKTAAQNITDQAYFPTDTTLDFNIPGTNAKGIWSVTSGPSDCGTPTFSEPSNPKSTFTGGGAGTYILTWTVAGCSSDVTVTLEDCSTVNFDGIDDYATFGDAFNRSNNFSFEAWVKPNSVTGTQTILSKRNANNNATGYDLSLNDRTLIFNWNSSGTMTSPYDLTTDRWYHVAVTFGDGTYQLFIDGISVASATGATAPITNTSPFLLGAMDHANSLPNKPVRYFNGYINEVRIWKATITQDQIRQMMNQQIKSNGAAVDGEVVPLNVPGLNWVDLDGYYRMDFNCGGLPTQTGNVVGKLRNMNSINQPNSAPIPYVSSGNNTNWNSPSAWVNGTVQRPPNSVGIDGITPIDWNIVRTGHDVTATDKEVKVLGLLVDAGRLTIQNSDVNDGQSIEVTRYLNIANGAVLDLVGESQLLQLTDESFVGPGTGILERDQQGTGNMFNYNYWGSPVTNAETAGKRTYSLAGILYDGNSPVLWTSGLNGSTSPVTLSTRWLYTFENRDFDEYNGWNRITQNTAVNVGLGFLMKGTGPQGSSDQNYTFRGQPNNGEIAVTINPGLLTTLIGNPYPSAIDANAFIVYNESALLEGALIFWEQAPSNNSHYLAAYQGRYSYLNRSGGVSAATPPGIANSGNALKEPTLAIPVGQGFFVEGSGSGGDVIFKNSQRIFAREAGGGSVFFRNTADAFKSSKTQDEAAVFEDNIQRVRLAFTTPENATRHLLLAFTPDDAATDGIDYGYDASNSDDFPSDLSFAIQGKKFVIQGVGAFDINKKYPLDMTMGITGNVAIALTGLENFDEPIDVYVHDALLDTYTKINTVSFQINLEAGNYNGRFSLVFQPDTTLSTIDQDFKEISVKYLQKTDEIYVKTPASIEVRQLYLINMVGQAVKSWNVTNMNFGQEFKIPVKDVAEGNYILQVETNTNSYNKKIIIKF